jgi:hypothetical protein
MHDPGKWQPFPNGSGHSGAGRRTGPEMIRDAGGVLSPLEKGERWGGARAARAEKVEEPPPEPSPASARGDCGRPCALKTTGVDFGFGAFAPLPNDRDPHHHL